MATCPLGKISYWLTKVGKCSEGVARWPHMKRREKVCLGIESYDEQPGGRFGFMELGEAS